MGHPSRAIPRSRMTSPHAPQRPVCRDGTPLPCRGDLLQVPDVGQQEGPGEDVARRPRSRRRGRGALRHQADAAISGTAVAPGLPPPRRTSHRAVGCSGVPAGLRGPARLVAIRGSAVLVRLGLHGMTQVELWHPCMFVISRVSLASCQRRSPPNTTQVHARSRSANEHDPNRQPVCTRYHSRHTIRPCKTPFTERVAR